ncbi:hypothetical protein [Spiroplasma endosymbiont of Nebria brevicollis]|uniref:hypothetical protein n=1 Tax=Spiroplasma endosymbiont of Nebria brevicollis TaxID=3066284 RepID=UPI00313B48BE
MFFNNSNNDIYFLSSDQNNGNQIYVLENGNTIPHKTDFDAHEVSKIAIDKNDNIYYASRNNDINEHIYIIKHNEKCSEKIGTIPYGLVNIIMLDSENNIFVGTTFYTYIFNLGENIIKRIDRLNEISFIVFDQENNAYFTNYQSNNIYTLSKNQIAKQIPIAKKIVELETNKKISSVTFNRNNIYFCANDICYSDIYKLV